MIDIRDGPSWPEPPLDIYFKAEFERTARERLASWRNWDDVKASIEWMFKHRFYRPTPVRDIDDQYWVSFNLTNQIREVSTWVFTYELNDERTRQANAIDLRQQYP